MIQPMTARASTFRKTMTTLENMALVVAGLVLLTMGLIIVASILGKSLFNNPIPDDLLMVGLLNVAVITLPLAYVERQRGHIAVTVTTDWLGTRTKGALRAFGALAMAVFFGGIAFMIARKMPEEIARNAYYDGNLQIPTWPMKALFGAAVLLFVVRLAMSVIEGLHTAMTGEEVMADDHHDMEV
jgi:TRAP-type C4-dicarboxylate transport system permease small subunit